MAYRLRYSINLDYVGPGTGPMGAAIGVLQGAQGSSGMSQTVQLDNAVQNNMVAGAGTGNAITSGDITTLTNNMAADIAAQLNAAALLARIQAWATSGQG